MLLPVAHWEICIFGTHALALELTLPFRILFSGGAHFWHVCSLPHFKGIDREKAGILMELCERGVNPDALAQVIKYMRRESAPATKSRETTQ